MSQSVRSERQHQNKPEILRCKKNEHRTRGNELQFLDLQWQVRSLLRLFAGGNLLAHFAGMRAVESFGDGRADGFSLEIYCEHVCPRDGLHHGPMPARRAQQSENQQGMAKAN